MHTPNPMLAPVIALVLWSAVIWAWMYATRIPAIFKARMVLDPMAPRGEQMSQLPATVRWKADNYNHLMEQPTIFYALLFYTYLAGQQNGANLALAWAYVASRVVHSLIQATINVVMVRFAVHVVGTAILMALAARDVMALLG